MACEADHRGGTGRGHAGDKGNTGEAAPDVGDVLQVNVGASGEARLIMRNKGNFRLLLNASIWPGMKVTPMDGGKVGPLSADSPSERTARPLPSLAWGWREGTRFLRCKAPNLAH